MTPEQCRRRERWISPPDRFLLPPALPRHRVLSSAVLTSIRRLEHVPAGWHGVDILVGTKCRFAGAHPAEAVLEVGVVSCTEERLKIGNCRRGEQLFNDARDSRCCCGEGSYHPVLGVAECRLCFDGHRGVVT